MSSNLSWLIYFDLILNQKWLYKSVNICQSMTSMHMFIMWWILQVVFVWSLYFLERTCCILSFKSEYYCWNFPNDVLQDIGFPCCLIFFQLAAPNSCEGNWDANYRVDVGTSRVLVLYGSVVPKGVMQLSAFQCRRIFQTHKSFVW